MAHRLRHVALLLLGAVLLGTVGLAVGSWYGGRGTTPLILEGDQAQRMAAELLPGAEPTGVLTVHNYRYGVFLATDDFGSSQMVVHYGVRADCALSDQLRRNAPSQGWQGLRRVPGALCDGWQAERNGLTMTFTHREYGSKLRIAPTAPDGYLAATLTGTLLGAATGGALFWLAARRRPPLYRLVGMLVTISLLPGVALTWADLFTNRLVEPVWPIWWSLAPILVPLWLVLLLVGGIAYVRRQNLSAPAADARAAARDLSQVPAGVASGCGPSVETGGSTASPSEDTPLTR